ncbi:MAG: ABC transporter permease, partial [Bacteroidota bacterium]
MNLLKLSWKNLLYSPWSLLLSLILFALGTGLVSLLLLLNTQIQEKFEKNLADIDLVIGAKGSPMQLILCNMYHVDNPTGNISLEEARPFLNPKHPLIRLAVPLSLGDSYRSHRIVGTTPELVDSIYEGRIAEGKRWANDYEVNIGAAVAEATQLKIGDQFYSSHGFADDGINVHDHGQQFKVVGILEPSGSVLDQLILTTPRTVWLVHDHEEHDHKGEDHEGHDHEGHD